LPEATRRRLLLCGVAAAALLNMAPAQADWAALTLQELAQASELIVLAEFLGQEAVQQGDAPAQNIGVLKVEQFLKGQNGQNMVLLLLPLPRANGLVSSADVALRKGQRGLWYLRLRSPGLYVVDRPDRFVPLEAATPHLKALRGG
jgi:hypothetical protein